MSARVTQRIRLLGRIPDPEKKYRDEFTQEAEVELTGDDLEGVQVAVNRKVQEIRAQFTRRLADLGGAEYKEASQ
jgi:hypothetical protein